MGVGLATNQEIDYPQNLKKLLIKKENYHNINNSIAELKNLIDSDFPLPIKPQIPIDKILYLLLMRKSFLFV